jgi:DNA-binding SARP family transcriptional activator
MEHFYLKDCNEFNDWLVVEQSDRKRMIMQMLSKIEEKLEEKGELRGALEILKKMSFLAPFEDDVHVRSINIYSRLGQHSDAVKEYSEYSKYLANELGLKPSGSVNKAYMNAVKKANQDRGEVIHIEDKQYDVNFAAAAEMMRELFLGGNDSVPIKVQNWDGIDKKSKELFEALAKAKIITIGK